MTSAESDFWRDASCEPDDIKTKLEEQTRKKIRESTVRQPDLLLGTLIEKLPARKHIQHTILLSPSQT